MTVAFRNTAILSAICVVLLLVGWNAYKPRPLSQEVSTATTGLNENPKSNPAQTSDELTANDSDKIPKTEVAKSSGEGRIHGVIYDPDGNPVSEATVTLAGTDLLGSSTSTDTNGAFQFLELPSGGYGLIASSPGYSGRASVILTKARPSAFVRIILAESVAISGKVVDNNGDPIANASITPVAFFDERISDRLLDILACVSDEQGRFETPPLELGSWALRAHAEGYAQAVSNPVQTGTTGVVIVMESGGAISGKVIDVSDNTPVPGITLKLTDDALRMEPEIAQSDASGAFRFAALANGEYSVVPDDPQYICVDGVQKLSLVNGASVDGVVIEVQIGGEISGNVIDAVSREGIAGIEISTFTNEHPNAMVRRTVSDQDGSFHLTGLLAGDVELRTNVPRNVLSVGTRSDRPTVHIEPGTHREGVLIELHLGLKVTGNVLDAAGEKVAHALVTAIGNIRYQAYTDADGAFTLNGFSEDEDIVLMAEAGDLISEDVGPFTVPANGLDNINITLGSRRNSSISGTVGDKYGNPVRIHVTAIKSDSNGTSLTATPYIRTDGKGRFTLAGLPAGSYELRLVQESGGYVGHGLHAADVSLADGQRIAGLRLIYDETSSISITGIVVDPMGVPIASARIRLNDGSNSLKSAVSNARGEFAIHELAEVISTLTVEHPGYLPSTVSDITPPAEGVEVVMQARPLIRGRVVDNKSNLPVTTFEIAIVPLSPGGNPGPHRFKSVNNSKGAFELPIPFPANYAISVKTPKYEDAWVDLGRIEEGQSFPPVEVSMTPVASAVSGDS